MGILQSGGIDRRAGQGDAAAETADNNGVEFEPRLAPCLAVKRCVDAQLAQPRRHALDAGAVMVGNLGATHAHLRAANKHHGGRKLCAAVAPNAIRATTSIPVSSSALILLEIAEDYTGVSATVSFNGGPPLAIKSNAGEDVAHLEAGSVLYGVISGSTFRLSNDETIASLIFDARDEAEEARDAAVPAAQTATVKASEALASATVAAGYAAAAGISRVFSTKAEADAGLSSVAANAFVKVLVDESRRRRDHLSKGQRVLRPKGEGRAERSPPRKLRRHA